MYGLYLDRVMAPLQTFQTRVRMHANTQLEIEHVLKIKIPLSIRDAS